MTLERPVFLKHNNVTIYRCPEIVGDTSFTWDPSDEAAKQNCHFDAIDIKLPLRLHKLRTPNAEMSIKYAIERGWITSKGCDFPPLPCPECGGRDYIIFSICTARRECVADKNFAGLSCMEADELFEDVELFHDDLRNDDGTWLQCKGCEAKWPIKTMQTEFGPNENPGVEDWGLELIGLEPFRYDNPELRRNL
jgi:hypothetical protein